MKANAWTCLFRNLELVDGQTLVIPGAMSIVWAGGSEYDGERRCIVAPQGRDHWDKMGMRQALEALRSEAGEAMVLQNNYFIEEILPNAILRKLSDEEMAEYRRPFAEPGEGRRPTLTWPRQIPIAGEPADVHAIATEYAGWLGTSNVPKLFLKAEPGAILANDTLVNLVRGWPALTEKTVAGIHFVQEDSPDEIGRAIAGWMGALS